MTVIACPTRKCGRDMDATAAFCKHCRGTLQVAITNVSAHWNDLATLRTGQTRYGNSGGSNRGSNRGCGEQPLAMDVRFARGGTGSKVRADVMYVIVRWTQHLLAHQTQPAGPACLTCKHRSCIQIRRATPPRNTVTAQCGFLYANSDRIRVDAHGQEILADLLRIERALSRLVDRPPDRWMAGTCGGLAWNDDRTELLRCERKLYVEPGDQFVKCRDCGTTYDVAQRRDALVLEAEDEHATVAVIATVLTTLVDTSASTAALERQIRNWVSRGRLTPQGAAVIDGRHRPTYRFGDVLDLVTGSARHTEEEPETVIA